MEQKHLRHIITSLVALVALQGQIKAEELPALVVYIAVDQLRGDYLQSLEAEMGSGGFRRMLREGRVYRDVRFPLYQPNGASALASIHTGTYPDRHGLEASALYNPKAHKAQSLLWDEGYQGIYTQDKLSAKALLTPTLGDRLKEASGGTSQVYAIAPNAEEAIASGGVGADGVFWIDSKIGSWASSSFYPAMPPYIDRYNRSSEGPNKRLVSGSLVWKPKRETSKTKIAYTHQKSFAYRYQGFDVGRYKTSPLVNEEITNLAIQLIEQGGYELRSSPGLLSLTYSLEPQVSGELSAEDADAYLRLDADLERLLSAVDKKIGLSNCLIALSGTGYTTYKIGETKGKKVNRRLSLKRMEALLSMYLSALHGSGSWVEAIYNGRLYLNQKLISDKKLRLPDVQEETAQFLSEVEGIAWATSAQRLKTGQGEEDLQRLQRSVGKQRLADVYLEILPGWEVDEQTENPLLSPRSGAIESPFVLMRAGTKPEELPYEVRDVRDIVRAVCRVLRIRPPND